MDSGRTVITASLKIGQKSSGLQNLFTFSPETRGRLLTVQMINCYQHTILRDQLVDQTKRNQSPLTVNETRISGDLIHCIHCIVLNLPIIYAESGGLR